MSSPGIVLVTRFVQPGSNVFNSYVEYIDRDEATRKANENTYSAFPEYVGDYMDDKEKTFGIFSKTLNRFDDSSKKKLKQSFADAQEKGSLMWQTVISFNNDFLELNGLMNGNDIDEDKLMSYTRSAMDRLIEKEKLGNAVWVGSIHKNTDNIHIHVAYVDPEPSWVPGQGRCYENANGQLYQRGKFKQSSISAAKSEFANNIIRDKVNNVRINELKRSRMITLSRAFEFSKLKPIQKDYMKLYDSLPEDLRLLKYNNNAMKSFRPLIDQLTKKVISEYFADDFAELTNLLVEADEIYGAVYGESSHKFSEQQLSDLNARMGNVILRYIVEQRKATRAEQDIKPVHLLSHDVYRADDVDRALMSVSAELRKMCRDHTRNMRNELAYRQLSGIDI